MKKIKTLSLDEFAEDCVDAVLKKYRRSNRENPRLDEENKKKMKVRIFNKRNKVKNA